MPASRAFLLYKFPGGPWYAHASWHTRIIHVYMYIYTCYICIRMCIWYMSLGLLGGPTKLVNRYDLLTCFPSIAQAIIMLVRYLICVYMYVHPIPPYRVSLFSVIYAVIYVHFSFIYIFIRIEFISFRFMHVPSETSHHVTSCTKCAF